MTIDFSVKGSQSHIRKFLGVINQIINAIGEFEGHYDKKFNFSKLTKLLKIPASEINHIISLILNFQDKFERVFSEYKLKKKEINGQIYFITEKKASPMTNKTLENNNTTTVIEKSLSKAHSNLLNDIIYVFKHIERGKGFNLSDKTTELLRNVKELYRIHPYLFQKNGNNLLYPSDIALKLGDAILSYMKSGKNINTMTINNYNFIID
ncbi:MAG: hypothetical protein ACFFAH_16505 [Promethearchaeota archaeon]